MAAAAAAPSPATAPNARIVFLIMSAPRSAIVLFRRTIVLVVEKIGNIPLTHLRHAFRHGHMRRLEPAPQIALGRALAIENDIELAHLQPGDLRRRQCEGAGN